MYREPQRHYHNFFHLRKLYDFYDSSVGLGQIEEAPDRHTFLYSLWFHDVIYDPLRKDNEERSAGLFNEFAEENQVPAE